MNNERVSTSRFITVFFCPLHILNVQMVGLGFFLCSAGVVEFIHVFSLSRSVLSSLSHVGCFGREVV